MICQLAFARDTCVTDFVKLLGIHHITAIAGDPQHNVDFYTGLLGLRLAKRTVNFDDPSTYHLYFGDRTGRPGTAITFFAWPGARRGTRGTGQVVAASFAISQDAVDYWKQRLNDSHVVWENAGKRFGEQVLRLTDPDGLILELIASARMNDVNLDYSSAVRREFAIHGFHAPTLEVVSAQPTADLLRTFGFELVAEEKSRRRFSIDQGPATSSQLDLVERPEAGFGAIAAGTIHHIAFRCADEEEQTQWREKLIARGLHVTPVIDRFYFHSIYFREPGGILFEIATDGPGFSIDEPVEELGSNLKLPKPLEPQRQWIEQMLPPIELRQPTRL